MSHGGRQLHREEHPEAAFGMEEAGMSFRYSFDLELCAGEWERLASEDPMWAILTNEGKDVRRWSVDEFFATGEEEIRALLAELASLGLRLPAGRALDFGCGIGRLTQALGKRFEEIHGVDVSETMITLARRHDCLGDKCIYHLNFRPHLGVFDSNSFDFVYSSLVLQHIPPGLALHYVAEFVRVLKPGGLAVFQTISPTPLRRAIPDWCLRALRVLRRRTPVMGMYALPRAAVEKAVTNAGGTIEHVSATRNSDMGWRWVSCRFHVRKSRRR
jgi:2-polyprenyl-3-methyl-5-hydroxy-6-metoxy-1,4-benzoquinol methylase